jgi:polynucleotide 5'-hydroxyl-kinase GRC3/NOL9
MRYKLLRETTLIIRGPASFSLVAGHATIFGGPLTPNQKRIVSRQRQFPIETERHAELEILLGKSSRIFEIEGSTIPASWQLAAAALEEMQEGKVVILGPTDVGKSTLCVYLLNKLQQYGRNLRIIDADIGQTDLGPPTTIARAIPTRPIASMADLLPDARLFIGHTSPDSVQRKLIDGIQKLSTEDRSLTIINTDGWIVEPQAVLYKINLITEVRPDLLVGVAHANELQPILAGVRVATLKVAAADSALERSRADRRNARVNAYRRFLEGAIMNRVLLGKVQVSCPIRLPSLTESNRLTLRNLMVGILKEGGYLSHIGILIDIESDALRIYSKPVEIREIEIGCVKLSISGKEIGFL